MQNMQHTLQNVQYPLQNMQYKIKLSPSYPQAIPRVIPKKVLCHANRAVPPAKCAVPHAKCAVPPAKYAVLNKVIPKLSPELSPMDLSQKNGLEK